MSSIKLESNASGTGIFTIASPNSNTNRTLTIPDATGTIITTAGGAAISGTTGAFTTTVGVGGATPAASGAGITFPATASASSDANTLDDYEEGTWTPVVASGSGSITAYTSSGFYTKIGRVVSLYLKFTITTPGTASGQALITGIPFNGESTSQFLGVCRESSTTGAIYFPNVTTSIVYLQNSTNGGISWTASYTYECNIVYTI